MVKHKTKKLTLIRIILGIFFLILAVIGFILPILQGWLFLILGLGFLGWKYEKKTFKRIFKKKRNIEQK